MYLRPNPHVMVIEAFEKEVFRFMWDSEGWIHQDGINVFVGRGRDARVFLSLPREDTEEGAYLPLDCGLLASITVRNICCLSHSVYSILLQQPEWYETVFYVLYYVMKS